MRRFLISTFSILSVMGNIALADMTTWSPRPVIVAASERLAITVERLDDRLHALQVSPAVISSAHALEQTVLGLSEAARVASPAEINRRYLPIAHQVRGLMDVLANAWLFDDYKVARAWRDLRASQHELSHRMLEAEPFPEDPITPPPSGTKLNGVAYQYVDKGSLVSSETQVKGTGSIAFSELLKDGDNNYALGFSLADKGALTLAANSNAKLESGAKITFARDGKTLKVTLTAGGKTDNLSEEFSSVAADAPLKLAVDVHEHGHLIVWVGEGTEQEYAFANTDVKGRQWGLVLTQATVDVAKQGPPKEEHEDGDHDH